MAKYSIRKDATRLYNFNGASQPNFTRWANARLIIFIIIHFAITAMGQPALQPIGQWREHLGYSNTIQVVQGGTSIFAATNNNVFSVDEDGTINRFSKVNGLSEVGVNAIGWDAESGQLVVAYSSSNLDVLRGRIVKNIGDIKRSTVSGDKTIYSMYCAEKKAYLCTGIGIIVIDLVKYEVMDTWQIGNNGNLVKINGFTSDGQYYYAATNEGLKRAVITSSGLRDYRNWQPVVGNGLPVGIIANVVYANSKVVVQKNDSLFINNAATWSLLHTDAGWGIVALQTSGGKLLVAQRTTTGASRVLLLQTNSNIERTISQPGIISFPKSALVKDNKVWIADFFGGLSAHGSATERYIPHGPLGTASGEMVVHNTTLYVAAGEVNDAWNYQYNRNGIYVLSDDKWSNTGSFTNRILDSVLDIITLAIDPRDASLWAGSYGGGLINISTQQNIKLYKQNSSLQAAIGDATSYRVSGLAFDVGNNLWISNYGAPQAINVRKADGTFKAFTIPFFITENAVSQVVIDDASQVWMVSPKGNGIIVFNPGNNLDNLADDRWKYLRFGGGNGNLPSNNVYCLAKDNNGFIWAGTSKGIAVIQCADQIFDANGCEAILPIVQQNTTAGYLFQDEEVRTIAIDGANRKWVGTKNGVWLVSANGEKIVYRFSVDNSPLLDNDVKKITIDPQTGEVYIATFKGICSFRSTATAAVNEMSKNVLVFPNPVPPGYTGTIAIRGVANNAIVKIAELNGRLVYESRALGGQAIWTGRNYKGEKVASGVYLVLIRDDTGTEKMVTKIVLVGGR